MDIKHEQDITYNLVASVKSLKEVKEYLLLCAYYTQGSEQVWTGVTRISQCTADALVARNRQHRIMVIVVDLGGLRSVVPRG